MEYGQAWLQEYDHFKQSGYETWSHSALDTRKIDELIQALPKTLITHNRIGISLAKMNYAVAYRDMKIKGKMGFNHLNELEKDIIAVQSNTPESVLEDYFRGKDMSDPDSSREKYDWAQDLASNVFNKGYFLFASPPPTGHAVRRTIWRDERLCEEQGAGGRCGEFIISCEGLQRAS